MWEPIPFGRDARGQRIMLALVWQSRFFGGLPRRGKTFAQRLLSAAGVLDPYVRHYVADGKGGADWRPMRGVAHRLVIGAEDEAITQFLAMLDELITEMGRRFTVLGGLPTSICPEGKHTPEIGRRYDLPVILITIDELQEYLSAMTAAVREEAVEKLARLARRGPAAGFILNAASQRPDAESVPAKLREIISYRYCTQVVDRTSSDMVRPTPPPCSTRISLYSLVMLLGGGFPGIPHLPQFPHPPPGTPASSRTGRTRATSTSSTAPL